jgi:hypothetical protein
MPNPFASGSPVQGEHFGDREEEARWLVRRMTTGQNVFISSPRRFGKTSLLLRAIPDARAQGARVGHANLFYCSDKREVAEHVTRAVVEGALGWLTGTVEQVRERFRKLPGVTPTLEHSGWKYGLAVRGPEHSWLEEIRRPVELLAESASDGRPVCLVIDEFQQIAEIDPGLSGVFKAICDDLTNVSIVFAGSRRHVMQRLFVGKGSALQNVADPLSLGAIPSQLMIPFLVERCVTQGRDLDPNAALEIYDLARGIPHFVQLLAASAFDRDANPITVHVARFALVDTLKRQQGELALRYESLSPAQKRLVKALAGRPVPDVYARVFLEAAAMAKSSAQRARDALEELEHIIFDERLGWRVADPIFERYLQFGQVLDLGEDIDPDVIAVR